MGDLKRNSASDVRCAAERLLDAIEHIRPLLKIMEGAPSITGNMLAIIGAAEDTIELDKAIGSLKEALCAPVMNLERFETRDSMFRAWGGAELDTAGQVFDWLFEEQP